MTTKKLSGMPYAQAKVTIDDKGNVALISYKTQVAQIYDGWLTINGLYSMTTRQHIGCFVMEYCGISFSTARDLYWENMRYNIYTGEVEKLEA